MVNVLAIDGYWSQDWQDRLAKEWGHLHTAGGLEPPKPPEHGTAPTWSQDWAKVPVRSSDDLCAPIERTIDTGDWLEQRTKVTYHKVENPRGITILMQLGIQPTGWVTVGMRGGRLAGRVSSYCLEGRLPGSQEQLVEGSRRLSLGRSSSEGHCCHGRARWASHSPRRMALQRTKVTCHEVADTRGITIIVQVGIKPEGWVTGAMRGAEQADFLRCIELLA